MRRHHCTPRPNWRAKAEEIGLTYHSHEHGPYWDESVCYELTATEVEQLERAAHALHYLCIEAAEAVIKNNWWSRLAIPEAAVPAILRSWERDDFSLYGRFDFAFDGRGEPKLLEYNADTPTALVEAAVAQWFWLQETRPAADQLNSIHERLIAAWRRWAGTTVHFSGVQEHDEDAQTLRYLRDTAEQAGVVTREVFVDDLGWDRRREIFTDLAGERVTRCFKLYPWEWLWREEFAAHLARDPVQWFEPAWKMLLSNKGLLPVLWELFPDHPNLLAAYDTPAPLGARHVRKPKLGREGANVALIEGGVAVEQTEGGYGAEGFVYQEMAELADFDGNHPVCGLWVVDHEPAGLGIREDTRRITGNLSRFVPHFFLP
jgi:glutathionylspermidine synthase